MKTSWLSRLVRGVPLCLLAVGCAPAVGLGSPLVMGLVASVALWALALGPAHAAPPQRTQAKQAAGPPAPPPPCPGTRYSICELGRTRLKCCRKGQKCPDRAKPMVDCGYGQCVSGKDKWKCPVRKPITVPAASASECSGKGGSWEKACVDGTVKQACIRPVPTNYMGPPRNPRFQDCGKGKCTMNMQREACFPKKGEIADKACKYRWVAACVRGHVDPYCLPDPPTNYTGTFYPGTKYTECGKGRCLVGSTRDKKDCP